MAEFEFDITVLLLNDAQLHLPSIKTQLLPILLNNLKNMLGLSL